MVKWKISNLSYHCAILDSEKTTNETTTHEKETSELLRELIANRLELNPRAHGHLKKQPEQQQQQLQRDIDGDRFLSARRH